MATQLKEPEIVEQIDDGGTDEGQTTPRDFEAEAHLQGWRPREEFKGDPDKFVDAESYLKRGDEVLPLLKKQVGHLKQEIDQLKRENKKIRRLEQSAYSTARADIIAEMEAAVETGDLGGFRKLREKMDTLESEAGPASETHGEDPAEQFDSFREANAWYDKANLASASETEVEARMFADRLADRLTRQGVQKDLAPSDFFARIARETEERFPLLKAKAARQKPTEAVAAPTGRSGQRGAKTGANLPQEAKDTVKRYMRQGIYKGTFDEACNAFAKDYDWSESK